MTNYRITLTTRDGHDLNFICADDCDLISASERASIVLPSACRGGCCGECLAHCDEGEYLLGACKENVLPAEAVARRQILLCRTYPRADLHISAPYDISYIQYAKLRARQAVVSGLEMVADRTARLLLNWLDREAGHSVEFEPGQCMELEIPGTDVRRAYSLANNSNPRGEMEFLIRLQAEGRFSAYLSGQAKVGQTLNVYGPNGAFGLQSGSLNPAIFIAGGAGLAPFLSMLRRLAERGEDRAIHLIFGVNRESELFYVDELRRLQALLPSLRMTICLWRPADDWDAGFVGTPADAFQEYLARQPGNYDVYLCGPPLLVAAATRVALGQGIDQKRIFSENFG